MVICGLNTSSYIKQTLHDIRFQRIYHVLVCPPNSHKLPCRKYIPQCIQQSMGLRIHLKYTVVSSWHYYQTTSVNQNRFIGSKQDILAFAFSDNCWNLSSRTASLPNWTKSVIMKWLWHMNLRKEEIRRKVKKKQWQEME